MFKVGFIDSGVGGLIFAMDFLKYSSSEIEILLNKYKIDFKILHFGDTKNIPYGNKKSSELYTLVKNLIEITAFHGAKIIVVACNTASIVIDEEVMYSFKKRGIEVLTISDISAKSLYENGKIVDVNGKKQMHLAVLGTVQTINSQMYQNILHSLHKNDSFEIKIHTYSPIEWVDLIECGASKEEMRTSVYSHLKNFHESIGEDFKYISALGLFCTHYPYLEKEIKNYFSQFVKEDVKLISQGKLFKEKILNTIGVLLPNQDDKMEEGRVTINSYITGNNLEQIKKVVAELYPSADIAFWKI